MTSSLRVTSVFLISVLVLAGCTYACPPGFLTFKESCYWFSTINATFAEARSYCGFLNSRLATIRNKEEDDFVTGTARMKSGTYFFGATDLGSEGIWKWEGGLDMVYDKGWAANEPNNNADPGDEDCISLWPKQNYKWNDVSCTLQMKFICKRCHLK